MKCTNRPEPFPVVQSVNQLTAITLQWKRELHRPVERVVFSMPSSAAQSRGDDVLPMNSVKYSETPPLTAKIQKRGFFLHATRHGAGGSIAVRKALSANRRDSQTPGLDFTLSFLQHLTSIHFNASFLFKLSHSLIFIDPAYLRVF